VAGDDHSTTGYVRPRIALAFLLVALLALLLFVDATSKDYTMSDITLTVLVGSVLTLVGIEVHDLLRGGK
jgi:hypothetical protein